MGMSCHEFLWNASILKFDEEYSQEWLSLSITNFLKTALGAVEVSEGVFELVQLLEAVGENQGRVSFKGGEGVLLWELKTSESDGGEEESQQGDTTCVQI